MKSADVFSVPEKQYKTQC